MAGYYTGPESDRTYVWEVEAPFGPTYPALPSVNKHRKLDDNSPAGRKAYGAAVLEAIRALQRSELMRAGVNRSEPKPNCASGTAYTTGTEILKAVRAQNRANYAKPDPNFNPAEYAKRYHAIMAQQHAARQAESYLALAA